MHEEEEAKPQVMFNRVDIACDLAVLSVLIPRGHRMPLPTTLLGLLDACNRQPEETPRLILADWLDDNNDPERAELIRLQCALDPVEDSLRDADDLLREDELLTTHRRAWLGPLTAPGWVWQFKRGLGHLHVSGESFTAMATRLKDCDELAWLESVRLEVTDEPPPGLFRHGIWRHVASLVVDGVDAGVPLIRALEQSRTLDRLRSLELTDWQVTPAVVEALAISPLLARLERLCIDPSRWGYSILPALAASPHIRALRRWRSITATEAPRESNDWSARPGFGTSNTSIWIAAN